MKRAPDMDQKGALNILLIPLLMSSLLLLVALGFSVWAFASRSDYKNNSDQKAAAASQIAAEKAKTEKDNEFVQKEKEPYKNYNSPSQFGSISMQYPKTWSSYSDQDGDRLTVLMQPDVVSSDQNTPYALKIEILTQPYDQTISTKDSDVKQGKIKASAFSLAKVPNVLGLRIDGQISQQKTGAAVYLPLRDKTLVISSESPDKVPDFNNIILPNFQFSP